MILSLSLGRARRAPAALLSSTFVYPLALALACTPGESAPNPKHGAPVGAVAPATANDARELTEREGGTGIRAKGEEASSGKRYAVAGPKDQKAAPASPAPSSLGALGAGQGFGAGHGRLGGAHKARAPLVRRGESARARAPVEFDTEAYAPIAENQLLRVADHPLSTFAADVDTASFSNARRFLSEGRLPPKDSIRVEEWINYFSYPYAPPAGEDPVAIHTEVSNCPWAPEHRLVRVGIKARPIAQADVPPRNLVFLLDVSGSMAQADKLPLLKSGLGLLARSLRPQDSVAIVVYAGASGLVLPATSGARQDRVLDALESLEAGGSTNGGEGIRLAYRVARQTFKKGGINRVILATDGDFNVGTTSEGELQRLIEDERKSGVFLTVLGFGSGNVKDSTMELLADKGNGNYAYIDSIGEAKKVLVREAGATLVTVAKDVKLQIEWNPARAHSYRLIGYENRLLAKEDFNDDRKDAGDMGAGHDVTALYEVVPAGVTPKTGAAPALDPLKYQAPPSLSAASDRDELLTVNVRYKRPDGVVSKKLSHVVPDRTRPFADASDDQRFAAAVAHFALVLRESEATKGQGLGESRKLAQAALGDRASEERRELVSMIDRARGLRSTGGVIAR